MDLRSQVRLRPFPLTAARRFRPLGMDKPVSVEKAGQAALQPARKEWAKAGEGNRTLVCSLGSYRSTIELHPRIVR
jgi:hypothetical protein